MCTAILRPDLREKAAGAGDHPRRWRLASHHLAAAFAVANIGVTLSPFDIFFISLL
ncbi:hypothetical protein [Rhizobium hidalgonense]|uniref:hypothetical protein n=1 Tax=Rhizobium hidalgonense TaxID=1538159 RepID=UPI0028729C9B|nr:hypothetical protein [Rhizobium hidalgonense]MDR9807928.1 hypothetical protein [Rhizobium hidalgonense]